MFPAPTKSYIRRYCNTGGVFYKRQAEIFSFNCKEVRNHNFKIIIKHKNKDKIIQKERKILNKYNR